MKLAIATMTVLGFICCIKGIRADDYGYGSSYGGQGGYSRNYVNTGYGQEGYGGLSGYKKGGYDGLSRYGNGYGEFFGYGKSGFSGYGIPRGQIIDETIFQAPVPLSVYGGLADAGLGGYGSGLNDGFLGGSSDGNGLLGGKGLVGLFFIKLLVFFILFKGHLPSIGK